MFLVARITISKYWKQSMVPLDYVKNKLNWITPIERLACILCDSTNKFDATWDPGIRYLSITKAPLAGPPSLYIFFSIFSLSLSLSPFLSTPFFFLSYVFLLVWFL